MSETELIPFNPDDVVITKYADDDTFKEMSSSSKFLPRLQLFGSKSEACSAGKIGINRYGIVPNKDTIIDLGPEVFAIPMSWRFKALRIEAGTVTECFNPKDPLFQEIKAESAVPNSGSMFGIEFLLWLGERGEFVSFYLNSDSARKIADDIKALLMQPMKLSWRLAKNAKWSWVVPVSTPSSTPIDFPADGAHARATMEVFANPKEEEKAPVEERAR